jgi:electron transport complex protein RnfG
MNALLRYMLRTAALLGAFAVVGTALVALTFEATKEPIAASERAALLRNLHEIVPRSLHDNDLYADVIQVTDPDALGTKDAMPVYRARNEGEPVALVITCVAPDGYSGNIHLLVGIHYNGSLLGVRAIHHRETPGLGDAIDADRSDWIHLFDNKSLGDPPAAKWRVKKDGGNFDQLTGATITPRAVVAAVKRSLQYYETERDMLFTSAAEVTHVE